MLVYDPSDAWSSLGGPSLPLGQAVTLEREGLVTRMLRLPAGPLPPSDVLIGLVPDRVFDQEENATATRALTGHRLFIAGVDSNLLAEVPRAGFGFEELIAAVRRSYRAPLMLVVEADPRETVADSIRLVFKLAHVASACRSSRAEIARLTGAGRTLLRRVQPTNSGLASLATAIDDAAQAKQLRQGTSAAEGSLSAQTRDFSLRTGEWETLAGRYRDRCLAAARGVKYHGVGAENIVEGVAELLADVALRLELDLASPPCSQLVAWTQSLRLTLATPGITLPIVGLFSSGKTTLINHILGSTPDGHPLLRTSQAHNTALLAHFHLKSPEEQNRVSFKWRDRVDLELLRHDDPEARPIASPGGGVIESVASSGDGGRMVTVRTDDGALRWATVPNNRRLLADVRKGFRVRHGQALTDGLDADAQMAGLLSEPASRALSARPWAILSMIRFLAEGRLDDVRLSVRWRELRRDRIMGDPFAPLDEVLSPHEPRGMEVLRVLEEIARGYEDAKELRVAIPHKRARYPMSVAIQARIRPATCVPADHVLETDADWNWFQGPAISRSTEGDGPRGFAESPLAAWLIERADIRLDTPLFRLVSLADTPGLNSISEHHDRITEQVIQDGHAFLVMVLLGKDTKSGAMERVLHMIRQSLEAHRVPRGDWRDRVFVVMNWKDREVGARTSELAKASVEYLRGRLRAVLETDSPRTYVVNLAPTRAHENPDELLGYPSLAPLKRDLRTFLALRGLGGKLSDALQELAAILTRRKRDLENEAIPLRGGHNADDMKRLGLAIETLAPGGSARKALATSIQEAVDAVTSPILQLNRELSRDYQGKDDFAQAGEIGPTFIRAYHAGRLALIGDVPAGIDARLQRLGGEWVSDRPKVDRPAEEVALLPTLAPDALANDAAAVVRDWPGGWSRFWHAVFNFEYHVTTQRSLLCARYADAAFVAKVAVAAQAAGKRMSDSVNAACDALHVKLTSRRATSLASASDRAARLEEIERQLESLRCFEPAARRMSDALRRCVLELEGKTN
ncbi:MAG: hypothetical protein V4850_17725 [Myxococcota bacterium]